MRHRKGFNRLSRKDSQRKALVRGLVTSLFKYERLKTTLAKAKEAKKLAERLITRAKEDNVQNRRIVSKYIYVEAITAKLFKDISPRFKDRKGGYTRILKLKRRNNDAAEIVIFELVVRTEIKKEKKEKEAPKKEKEEVKA